MSDQFTMDKKGIKQLEKFFKKAPHAFQRVSAGTLNSMAFADRLGVQKQLTKTMTIRTPSLLKKGTRVQTANKSQSIDRQHSISGSVRTARHDAWEATEQGKSTRITQFADAGRQGGTKKGKARKEAKAGRHTRMEDFTLKGSTRIRTIKFLQAIQRDPTKRRKPWFLQNRYKSMERGIYKFKGGRVSTFSTGQRKYKKTLVNAKIVRLAKPKAKIKPKKFSWKEKATKKTITESFIKKAWSDNMQRELDKIVK